MNERKITHAFLFVLILFAGMAFSDLVTCNDQITCYLPEVCVLPPGPQYDCSGSSTIEGGTCVNVVECYCVDDDFCEGYAFWLGGGVRVCYPVNHQCVLRPECGDGSYDGWYGEICDYSSPIPDPDHHCDESGSTCTQQCDCPSAPPPPPTLSPITPTSPYINSVLQTQLTVPAFTNSPDSLDWEWYDSAGNSFASGTTSPLTQGSIIPYSLDCAANNCGTWTQVSFHSVVSFSPTLSSEATVTSNNLAPLTLYPLPSLSPIQPSPGAANSVLSTSATIPFFTPQAQQIDWEWRDGDGNILVSAQDIPVTGGQTVPFTYDCAAQNCQPGSYIYFHLILRFAGGVETEASTPQVYLNPPSVPTNSLTCGNGILGTMPCPQSGECYDGSICSLGSICPEQCDTALPDSCIGKTPLNTQTQCTESACPDAPCPQSGICPGGGACQQTAQGSICPGGAVCTPGEQCTNGQTCPQRNCACAPYTCQCIVTSYECGNGVCEGAESLYCANAPPDPASDCYSAGGTEDLVYLGFAITIFLIALAYMYSKFFAHGNAYLDVWLRDEATHLGWSVLFAVLLLSAGFLGNSLSSAANFLDPDTYSGTVLQETVIGDAVEYLDELSDQGMDMVAELTEGSIKLQEQSTTLKFTGKPFMKGKGVGQGTEKRAYSASQELAIDLLIPMVLSLKVQSQFLKLIAIPSLFISFLSIALFLRVIPFTRKAGNYLLALCFSLFVLLPILYLFFSNIHTAMEATGLPAIVEDNYIDFAAFASLLPQAVFLPNIAFIIAATATTALAAAIRAVSE